MASQLKPTRNFGANTRDTDKFDDGHQRQRRQQQRSGGGGAMQLRPTSCAVNIDSPLLHCYYHDIASNANMSEPSTPFFIFNRWKSFRSNCRLIDPWRHNKQLFNHLKALIVKFHPTKRRKSLVIFRTRKIGNMFFFCGTLLSVLTAVTHNAVLQTSVMDANSPNVSQTVDNFHALSISKRMTFALFLWWRNS